MRILFLAPQPFFQERGTPIAIDLMLASLSERGDSVDLVTFHLGKDRRYSGLSILRIDPPFAPKAVKPGFSFKKIYCDLFLLGRAFKAMRAGRYDLIHAVEEGVFIAMLLGVIFRVPYVYDMDSSMARQLLQRFPWLRPLGRPLVWLETIAMKRAIAVVPMCEALASTAREHCDGIVHVLKDVSLLPAEEVQPPEDLRKLLGIDGPIVMYVGNLETYQGVDLLLTAFAEVIRTRPDAQLVIIGGTAPDVETYRYKARTQGVGKNVHLTGPRSVAALGGYLSQADILVSPRIDGENTPLKIYSYLDSGVPVVATELPTHTQVVSSNEAALAPPEPAAMAAAIVRLLDHPAEGRLLVRNARRLVQRNHTSESFRRNVNRVFGEVEARVTGGH